MNQINQILTTVYRNIEDELPVRELHTDESGVVLLCGMPSSTYAWIAFRLQIVDPESQGDSTDAEQMRFRVIRLQPSHGESFGVNRQTGQVERQSQFHGCQYMIADVTIRSLDTREKRGTGLRAIQGEFPTSARKNPVASGRVNTPRSLISLYRQWVAQETEVS